MSGTFSNASAEKQALIAHFNSAAADRRRWREKASFFHKEDERYLRFLIPEGSSVLEIGCGNGDTLAALSPGCGVGIDINPGMVAQARALHPAFTFHVGDAEILADLTT